MIHYSFLFPKKPTATKGEFPTAIDPRAPSTPATEEALFSR
jgi:hypothetical protein